MINNIDFWLGDLERAELVRRLAGLLPETEDLAYLFKHALVQDTAYSSLLKNERKRLHRLIGETLERSYPNARAENAALLTKHYIEAGDNTKILEYGVQAGDAAAHIYANAEAIEYYRAALDAALRLDAHGDTLTQLVTKLGRMYEMRDEYAHALDTYARLSDLARTRNDPRYELTALMLHATLRATPTPIFDPRVGQEVLDRALLLARELNDGAAEAKILWNLLLLHGFTGRHVNAVTYGEQSLELARRLNLRTQIAYTLNDIGNYGYFASGQLAKSRAALTEARAMWRELEILPMLGDNLNNSGILEYIRGDYAQARTFSDEALEISERIGSVWGQSLAHAFRGQLAAERGEYGAALAELQSAYELGKRTGTGILLIASTNLALAYAWIDEIPDGYAVIRVAVEEIEIPIYRTPAKSALAYLTFLQGEGERARVLLEDARPRHPDELQFSYLPAIIAEGEIGLAQGRTQDVVQEMTRLADNLLRFGVKSFIADADLYRGRALTDLGRIEEGRAAFERAEAYARELDSQRALWQIYYHWATLERVAGSNARAEELNARARGMLDTLAETLPEKYRAGFMRRAVGQADDSSSRA